MQLNLSKILVFIRRFGLKNEGIQIEAIHTNVFNLLLIPLFGIHLFFLIRALLLSNPTITLVSGIAFIGMLIMLLLNFFGKYDASKIYFNFTYPLIAGIIPIYIETFNGLDYTFFVFILISIFLSEKLSVRIFFTLYNTSIYLFVNYYITSNASSNPIKNYGVDQEILFLMTTFCIFSIVSYFYGSIIKHEQHNRKLLENLTENNTQLNIVNQELERFNHIASHDLKTPLRSIMSFSSLIQRDLNQENYKNLEEYFQFIKNSANQMNSLITDTLEYSKLDNHAIQQNELDLNQIVANLSKQIKTSHTEDIEINYSQLPSYNGNEFLLIRLFQNIFENGIKYNKSEKKIIDVDFKVNDATLILEITDNGIGIEKKYLDQIFVLFKRLHTSTEFTGTGLGLSICKKIVENLNGSIWANSEIGKGSTFYISLPLSH